MPEAVRSMEGLGTMVHPARHAAELCRGRLRSTSGETEDEWYEPADTSAPKLKLKFFAIGRLDELRGREVVVQLVERRAISDLKPVLSAFEPVSELKGSEVRGIEENGRAFHGA